MAEKGLIAALSGRTYTKRERFLMLLVMLSILAGLVYRFPYAALEKKIAMVQSDLDNAEKAIPELGLQIADLNARAADIKAGAKGWQLVDQKGVILVLEDVSAEARKDGVNILSVHPSQEIDKETHKEVSLNLDLKGRYRQLAEYFKHLENQSRLVNIRKIRVEACPDSSSACATQLEAVTYLAK
jgi:Tfp pilus assembly protein PilO